MQEVTADGLRPASEGARRWTVVPIYGGSETFARGLEETWKHRTPAEEHLMLSQPDVTVTNASDKVVQLGKLSKLDERVRAAMATA